MLVNDRSVSVLENYDFEVIRTQKSRNAILCETNKGWYILKEYKGPVFRLEMMAKVLEGVRQNGFTRAEQLLYTKEGATPGHGIEWARLITQWALSTFKGDKEGASKYITVAENLYNRAIEDAWNADGAPGIVYTTDWNGKPVVHDRMHWTLAEAINTSAVLFHVTGNQKYADNFAEFMQYLDEKVLDHVHGSWFHQLDANNNLDRKSVV